VAANSTNQVHLATNSSIVRLGISRAGVTQLAECLLPKQSSFAFPLLSLT
jgi:hypothetical protein